jgi:uncharacterized membrane protein
MRRETVSGAVIPDSIPQATGIEPLEIRKMSLGDIKTALAQGYDDLKYCRTDALLMAVIFPVAGVVLAGIVVVQGFLPFVFPLLSGFSLLGPLATLWFAALSRQRERRDDNVFAVFAPPRLRPIERLSAVAVLMFLAWNAVAGLIYYLTLGRSAAEAGAPFFQRVFTTTAGWEMIVFGCLAGAVFALATLAISVISFPLIIDRPVTASQAIAASLHALARNPVFVFGWGAVVAVGLILGSIPCLLGMVIVLPVLGHATWHVYRRMVV